MSDYVREQLFHCFTCKYKLGIMPGTMVPSHGLIISALSHWATDSGDKYIHLIIVQPYILTKSGDDARDGSKAPI